jgi:hypothetical protein
MSNKHILLRLLRIIGHLVVIGVLTVFTQVGGLVYLLVVLELRHRTWKRWFKLLVFWAAYLFTTLLIVPNVAPYFGRVALPLTKTKHLQAHNLMTCLLNRNYVRPELLQTVYTVAAQLQERYPDMTVNYLEANFPFIDGFPLAPHLSHNDGKKLDLSFCYLDAQTGKLTNDCPSWLGYGICEVPLPNEPDRPAECAAQGYWVYSWLMAHYPQGNRRHFRFDAERTRALVNAFAEQATIGKIYIEPHLKVRLRLTSDKIWLHGCQSVRHDDHVHVQLQ